MLKIKLNYKCKQFKNKIKQNKAVSEILGTVFLLGIVVSSFSVIYFNVLSIPPPSNNPNVTIISYIKDNKLILEHQKGDSLNLNDKITLKTDIKNDTFLVKNYLDSDAKQDGEWNIGERIIYPFSYNISNIQSHFTSYIYIVDIESNSIVFTGSLEVYPETDLSISITADNMSPSIGSKVNFTICVTNENHGTPVVNIEILNSLSKNFSYYSHNTTRGSYNSSTCIWNISYLDVGESACLTITTIVILTSEETQLAMILDGSGSISSTDWNIMKEGLARSIENSSIFPHDGNVELTVIQFGNTIARVELEPTTVRNNNYVTIGNKIRSISQIKSSTPMACGIRLAADKLRSSAFFEVNNRQLVTLITDGVANCYWTSGYSGTYQGFDGWIKGDDFYHTGESTAKSSSSRNGDLYCDDLNTTGATNITVDFWFRLDNTEDRYWNGFRYVADNDLLLYYYDGTNYDLITNLGGGTEDTWLHYTHIITDSQYLKQNFKILVRSYCENGENVWIDDVIIKTNSKDLLNDSFESEYWADKWWNRGLKSAEDAQSYLINKLQMTNDRDEFDSLGVGIGGMYGGPDVYWLKNNIVWPQPGYIAPPYIAGWLKTITSWQEFEDAIIEIFKGYFGISNINNVKIIKSTPSIDLNPEDNKMSIILTPK